MLHDRGGDLADTDLVMHALEDARDLGVQGIVWTGGGEPTTHPDWLAILHHARSLGLQQGMYTLGALITKEQADEAKNLLSWVVVSLDHADQATYAKEKKTPAHNFYKACEAIKNLTGGKAVVGVSFLLHAGNYTKALDMLALSRSLGSTYTTFRPLIETSPADPGVLAGGRSWVYGAGGILELLQSQPDVEIDPARFHEWASWQGHGYTTCLGVRLNATITPDGRIWVCPNRREYQGSCLGDLRSESFSAIWARHPGHVKVDKDCRAMCRLHPINQTLDQLEQPRAHEAFL
jgi:MoaA/NifB/PqqE/SkfB family radical SAM enzyme